MTSPSAIVEKCPCGSGAPYRACCGPLHDGDSAETAEALMRARYSAFATGRTDYVFRTWHPRTRPADLSSAPGVTWVRLEVLRAVDGGALDEVGTVEFRAWFLSPDGEQVMQETSRFKRQAGQWLYVDGDVA